MRGRDSDIDTTKALVVAHSPGKLVLFVLGSAAFVASGIWLLFQDEPLARGSVGQQQLWGYLAVAFFGLIMLVALARLFTAGRPVLTLSAAGLRDERISTDIIPWRAIASIDTWAYRGQRIIVLGLYPGEEQKLRLRPMVRWTRRANAMLGADGLSVTASGTRIGHDELLAAITAFAGRYGNIRGSR